MKYLLILILLSLSTNAFASDEREIAADKCLERLKIVAEVLASSEIQKVVNNVHGGININEEDSIADPNRSNDKISFTLNGLSYESKNPATDKLEDYPQSVRYIFTINGKASDMNADQLIKCEVLKVEKDLRK